MVALPGGSPVCQQTYGKQARGLDSGDHHAQLYPENAQIRVASIHTSVAGKHAFLFGSINTFFFFKCWYYHSSRATEEEAFLFSRSNFELIILYANFSCKLCIWIATGHKELNSKNLQNKQQEKANKFSIPCL